MHERVYAIPSPFYLVIRDAAEDERLERLRFHIRSGDYFPLLATFFGFVEEALRDCASAHDHMPSHEKLLSEVRKDLMHLHKHYQIVPNDPQSRS